MLLLVLFPLLVAAALAAPVSMVQPDPSWPQVTVRGNVDRPLTLADHPLLVAASLDKASPFEGRYLAVCPLDDHDQFSCEVPSPPGGLHFWVVVDAESGGSGAPFQQLYNHYPLVLSGEGQADLHFTMADYCLTFEGVDPWADPVGSWWWLFLGCGLGLSGILVGGRLLPRQRAHRLPPPGSELPVRREAWLVVALLLLAAVVRIPSMGESFSMTEFVHAQIAAGVSGDHDDVGGKDDTPRCAEVCSDLATHSAASDTQIGDCERACLEHFGQDVLPAFVLGCLHPVREPSLPMELLRCLEQGGGS